MILPSRTEPGTPLPEALILEDVALEVSITPNRGDCASIIGIAREIAALTGNPLKERDIKLETVEESISSAARVTLEDPEGCPRYAAGMVRGMKIDRSPFWLRYRLSVCGVRSISNVVDVTNYILLELGQPLHAFDYDRLHEHRIVVRKAHGGEHFTTLDGKRHTLDDGCLMICDGKEPVALAGIMGGLNSEISEDSRNVLVESACFDPITIRRASKRLGISTEASYRFERGVDIELAAKALDKALALIHSLAGGEILKDIIDEYPRPFQPNIIDLRVEKVNQLLGTQLTDKAVAAHLESLNIKVERDNKGLMRVTAPSYRVDITREVDLIEEVGRREGFDNIPVTIPQIRPADSIPEAGISTADKIKEIMVGLGFSEIISYSFISPESADTMGAEQNSPIREFVHIVNPLSVDQSVMRTSLMPGLLSALQTNMAYGQEDLKLFEWGKVFFDQPGNDGLPKETFSLGAAMSGLFSEQAWHTKERAVDFFDMKGALEVLFDDLGLSGVSYKGQESTPGLLPGASAAIQLGDRVVGHVGQVHPKTLEGFHIKIENCFIFEVDIEAVISHIVKDRQFKAIAKYPAVVRDISLIVTNHLESVRIIKIIEAAGGSLVESVRLYDLYEGGKIDASEKALTFRIQYRSNDRTLDGQEINELHDRVIQKIMEETGARLREG
jgi:phenylalanyl-tRNA synthetase beta chain